MRIFELEKSEISGELKQLRNEKLHFTVRTLIHHCYVENTHNGRAFCPICIIYPRSMVHIYMAFVSHYTVPLFKHTLKYSLRNLNCLINDTVEYTVTAVNMCCKHENVRILMNILYSTNSPCHSNDAYNSENEPKQGSSYGRVPVISHRHYLLI